MPIDQFDFEALTEADLSELIEGSVPEGLHIEYKRDLYGQEAAQKKEALKDISAFANAGGGHLIIGISESRGIAESLSGVAEVNPDQVVQRLQNMVRDGIEPRIQGVKVKAIPVNGDRHAFVIRIPRSWNPPHRVSRENSNRYWIRNSNAVHEASMDELRMLFTQDADARRRAVEFRDQRLLAINDGPRSRSLHGTGRLILHIIPLASLLTRFSIDLEQAHQQQTLLSPPRSAGGYAHFNFDGFAIQRTGVNQEGYTQVFRNGIVEAALSGLVVEHLGRHTIPGITVEQVIMESSTSYLNALRALDVPAPLLILVTLGRIYRAVFAAGILNQGNFHLANEPQIEDDPLHLPECYIQAYGNDRDYHQALRPAIDVLWNTAGYPSARSFDEQGHWLNGRAPRNER